MQKTCARFVFGSVLSLLSFCGCSTTHPIRYSTPLARMQSPESLGVPNEDTGARRGIDFHGGVIGTEEFELSPDFGENAVSATTQFAQPLTDAGLSGGIGIFKGLDASIEVQGSTAPTLRVSYQFLGDNAQVAGPGNFSLSATAAVGSDSEDTTSAALFETSEATLHTDTTLYDGGLIAGYRFSPHLLVYGGVSETHVEFTGSQTLYSGANESFSRISNTYLEHVGMHVWIVRPKTSAEETKLPMGIYAVLEGDHASIKLNGVLSHENSAGLDFGILF